MPNGAIILVREGKKAIALCRVIGENFTSEELTAKYVNVNYRRVEVLFFVSDEDQPPPRCFSQGTLRKISNGNVQKPYIKKLYLTYLKKTQMNSTIEEYTQLLKTKKNLILQGSPGTGKTYTTASLAVRLCNPNFTDFADRSKLMEEYERLRSEGQIAFCTFHQSMDYEDFVEGLKPQLSGEQVTYNVEAGIFKDICQRAQMKEGLDILTCIDRYLQQIQGYENRRTIPTIQGKSHIEIWWNSGNVTLSIRSLLSNQDKGEEHAPARPNIEMIKSQAIGEGREKNWPQYAQAFIEAVKKEFNLSEQISSKPHVLIIDEINRGNVSRIFGELITLLEADKRRGGGTHPITLKLPYSKEDFSVPANLHILGTMNTTDRSTGALDYAVRRRFAFVTLATSRKAIEGYEPMPQEVRKQALALFDEINGQFIPEHKSPDFDLEDLKVGHSYFMASSAEELRLKMRYEVVPLLREYIKDGILSSKPNDTDYFSAWMEGKCYHPTSAEQA